MICLKCGKGKMLVVDSASDKDYVYRKRKCANCASVAFTEEYESFDADVRFRALKAAYRNQYRKERKNGN